MYAEDDEFFPEAIPMKSDKRADHLIAVVFFVLLVTAGQALGQQLEPILSLAKKEKPALLETLKELVSIETGSRDTEGLDKLAKLIAERFRKLTDRVE